MTRLEEIQRELEATIERDKAYWRVVIAAWLAADCPCRLTEFAEQMQRKSAA